MQYIQKTIYAGEHIFTEKCFSARYGKKNVPRGPNIKKCSDEQKRRNELQKKKRIIWLICENFRKGDWWITFTYRRADRPEDLKSAKKQRKKFIRRLRDILKRMGIPFVYMAMTERGTKGGLHHHFIIRNNFDIGIIAKLWEWGKVIIDDIYSDSLYDVAEYFTKGDSEESEKDFTKSKNLRQPRIKIKVVKAERWVSDPKPKKDYYIVHLWNGFHDFSGFPYQEYVQVRRC